MDRPPFELSVTHYIDAPTASVWKIMTERMAEWWCPKPWQTEIIAQEWRAGGRSALVMHGPNGEKNPIEGIFLEVTPGQRFVFTDALDANWNPQGPFMVGIFALEAEGAGTRYTASARHWTQEACKQHAEMGFTEGWSIVADQLAQLATQA